MTARHLLALFDSIYLSALAVWIGGAVFMVFGLNPILLKTIGSESASKFIRAIYPRYYLGGAIAGAVALPAFVAGPLCYREYRGAMVGAQALAIIFGIFLMLYGANSLTPAMGSAHDNGSPGPTRLESWQRLATGLNLLLIALALLLLVTLVIRPAPKTSGIIEMSPQERARYDEALNRVIEDVEVKYGLRPARPLAPGDQSGTGPDDRRRDRSRDRVVLRHEAGARPGARGQGLKGRCVTLSRQTLADRSENGVHSMEHPFRTVFTV